ncbi:glycine cleavage system transcriptional repressor [Desulforhopalus sp. 52FAK]
MKRKFVATVMGPASSGIVKSLAEATRELGGEWSTSKVMKLDGRFTAMMEVAVDDDLEMLLKDTLADKFPDLEFYYSDVNGQESEHNKTVSLVVDCKDRSGLTRDLNNILYNLDLVVENMDCNRFPVSSLGESVFSAKLTLAVNEEMSAEAIAEEIETLSEDTRVSVV